MDLATSVLPPSALTANPWEALSLGLANAFGPAGLPHVRVARGIRPHDRRRAHWILFCASGLIAIYFLAGMIVGSALPRSPAVTRCGLSMPPAMRRRWRWWWR